MGNKTYKTTSAENKMLEYGFTKTRAGIIYSLDRITISIEASEEEINNFLIATQEICGDIEHIKCRTSTKYHRHRIEFRYDDAVVTMCLHPHNCRHGQEHTGYIEFNPNKVSFNINFVRDFALMQQYIKFHKIKKFDIAVDIPIARENIAMLKETNKMYRAHRKSESNFTEYLGTRGSIGHTKLYNKKIESNLQCDLTRIEVTAAPGKVKFPRIIDKTQLKPKGNLVVDLVLFNDNFTRAYMRLTPYFRRQVNNHIEPNVIHIDNDCISSIEEYALSFLGSDDRKKPQTA